MSKNIFNSINLRKPKRNYFDLSHDKKMSLDMGRLTPVYFQECIPGDKITINSEMMIRLAPMVAPVMHRVNAYMHFFFVPNRILWENWEDFITGGESGEADPQFPTVTYDHVTPVQLGSIADYFGIPTRELENPETLTVSALPFAAYASIWNEYFRDQNLQEKNLGAKLTDGNNTAILEQQGLIGEESLPFRRAWKHDYFTSCLPFAQKGPEATIPLGTDADILYDPAGETLVKDQLGDIYSSTPPDDVQTDVDGQMQWDAGDMHIDNSSQLRVDLENAVSASINDLRRSFRLQEWLEKNARAGSRYIESILSHFGVRSSDARLQRPEYIGGGRTPILISEVLQMSASEAAGTPQGNLSGHGISVGNTNRFSKYVEEHGMIIGIMSVMPESAYQQGLPRYFSKRDKFDFFWPEFAHIGEQPVLNSEIYATGTAADQETFGYNPRYAEYRYQFSTVHGDFRETLNYWHLGRIFENAPALNSDFIQCDPGKRIFAVQDLPDDGEETGEPIRDWNTLYAHVYHKVSAVRPIPKWGTPTF